MPLSLRQLLAWLVRTCASFSFSLPSSSEACRREVYNYVVPAYIEFFGSVSYFRVVIVVRGVL